MAKDFPIHPMEKALLTLRMEKALLTLNTDATLVTLRMTMALANPMVE